MRDIHQRRDQKVETSIADSPFIRHADNLTKIVVITQDRERNTYENPVHSFFFFSSKPLLCTATKRNEETTVGHHIRCSQGIPIFLLTHNPKTKRN